MGKHSLLGKTAKTSLLSLGRCPQNMKMYINRSSTYKEFSIHIRSMPWIDCKILRIMKSGLIANAKRKGFKGQPYLVPLDIGKNCKSILFVITDTLGLEYSNWTQAINFTIYKPNNTIYSNYNNYYYNNNYNLLNTNHSIKCLLSIQGHHYLRGLPGCRRIENTKESP